MNEYQPDFLAPVEFRSSLELHKKVSEAIRRVVEIILRIEDEEEKWAFFNREKSGWKITEWFYYAHENRGKEPEIMARLKIPGRIGDDGDYGILDLDAEIKERSRQIYEEDEEYRSPNNDARTIMFPERYLYTAGWESQIVDRARETSMRRAKHRLNELIASFPQIRAEATSRVEKFRRQIEELKTYIGEN